MTSPTTSVHARSTSMLRSALGTAIGAWLDEPKYAQVMLNADGRLWIDRLDSGRTPTDEVLTPAQAERIIRLIAHHIGAEVHRATPRVSAELPDSGNVSKACSRPSSPSRPSRSATPQACRSHSPTMSKWVSIL